MAHRGFFISFVLFFTIAFAVHAQTWDAAIFEKANTAKNAGYMNNVEKQVVLYSNLIRLEPKLFADTYLKAYLDSTKLKDDYTRSLLKTLKNQERLPVLEPAKDLYKEAKDHAEGMGRSGKVGHNSPSGKSFKKRMADLQESYTSVGENCDYGNANALNIFMSLLIDEGVPDLGHRENILRAEYRYVGVSVEPHKKYRFNCVLDYAGEKR